MRYDKRLCANAKLLYGEITALCNAKGFCWAGNSYFSDLYEVSKVSISKWIKQLVDAGYLKTQLFYKNGTKEILHRSITIVGDPTQEKLHTPTTKVYDPTQEKFKDNTTLNNTNNTTLNNTAQTLEFVLPDWINPDVWKAYLDMRKSIKKPMTDYAKKLAIGKLDGYRKKGIDIDVVINQSILQNWTDLYEPKPLQQKNGHINKQEALEASNRAVVERLLAKEARYAQ